jgi:hypothetical protein
MGALLLSVAGIVWSMTDRRQHLAGRLLITPYPLVALAGFLCLLLDYLGGPVRTVQLVVYVTKPIAATTNQANAAIEDGFGASPSRRARHLSVGSRWG